MADAHQPLLAPTEEQPQALRYCRRVALLSQMIRTVAITGRTDNLNAWFASRQGGRWAEQTIRDAFPTAGPRVQRTPPAVATRPPADPDETLPQLIELHEHGVLTDAEFETLRTRLRV